MIRAIVFDLGKVIIPFDFRRGYDRMAPLCAYSAADLPARIGSCDLVARFESGQIAPEPFVEQLSELIGMKPDHAAFRDIWSSIFFPETLIPDEFLEALHRRYRLVLLSNTNAIHFPMVREHYPLLRHFDAYVLSYEVGALKPAPAMYREAIRQAGCAPAECFFTDDIAAYVEAAKKEGIDAVQFESYEQIQRELRARGVDW